MSHFNCFGYNKKDKKAEEKSKQQEVIEITAEFSTEDALWFKLHSLQEYTTLSGVTSSKLNAMVEKIDPASFTYQQRAFTELGNNTRRESQFSTVSATNENRPRVKKLLKNKKSFFKIITSK